ncbi:MAG: hypothetical protein KDD82_21960, partial [Planctomycetes bacterium]|nr:hypothetical protein [Planctomycetota bacterium]
WVSSAPGVVRVTLLGGPRDRAALDARALAALRDAGVEASASALTPSGRNLAWTLPAAQRARAVQALHRAFVDAPPPEA